jgi:hypothetical protein
MPRRHHICALCALLVSFATTLGCSSVGPRKYVFFGEPKPEKVEIFEDFWSDEYGAFKPDDPSLPLRRGKAGVVRFFKKNSYSRAILVDGTLTVNVYEGDEPGVTLTQPDAQMVLTSEELNESHRQFDKKTGYTYHIWLDLGEYDQPEKTLTLLSIFKDNKTGEATLSKPIVLVAPGTSPEVKDDETKVASEGASAAEDWAREALGDPVAERRARQRTARDARDVQLARELAVDVDRERDAGAVALGVEHTDARGLPRHPLHAQCNLLGGGVVIVMEIGEQNAHFAVAACGGILVIEVATPEGKKAQSAADLVNGRQISVGDVLGK